MISLMQEDTRKAKEHGAENLTIGYFVMKVTLLKQLSIIWVTSFHFWLCKPYMSEFVCFQSNICHFAVCLNAYQSLSSWRLSVVFSATMFVYVFLTAILPPTCACPSVCVIIIGVRLQFVFRYRCFYLSVYFCAFLPFWFPRLVIFLAFDLTILYCFRLSVCVCLLVCLTVCLSGTGVRLRTYVQFWVVWSFSVHFCQPSVSLFRP